MFVRIGIVFAAVTAAGTSARAQTPLGTAFTYQGKLDQSGSPVNGTADFQFSLFDAASAGNLIAGPVSVNNVTVTGGLFTVSIDFGATAFNGQARWLSTSVRSPAGGGAFTLLTTRQKLNGTPYALKVPGIDGFSLDAADGSPTDALFVNNAGNVGIGTTTPQAPLELLAPNVGALPGEGIRVKGTLTTVANQAYVSFHNGSGTAIGYVGDGSTGDNTVFLGAYVGDVCLNPATRALTAKPDGKVGIGTGTPEDRLHVVGNIKAEGAIRSSNPTNTAEAFLGWTTDAAGDDMARIRIGGAGNGAYNGLDIQSVGNVSLMRIRGDGTAVVRVLEITGADIAEKFPVSEKLEPGMVVAIDPSNPGKLCLARGAYNGCVAGVVSGANNFAAGAVLGNLPGCEDAPPVALSGRVYVHCDASAAPIQPGNLLTTSDVPGHAMKATDRDRSHGAVIGKAMTGLDQGRGLVLVLVNLQ